MESGLVSQSLPNQYLADPDVQLMLRVVGGDHHAFEDLVTRYQDRLIGFFFHLVRDRTLAEDMAQEVFMRVYRARERYSARARFSTWLFRIAHNLASNQKRGLARRKEIPLAGSNTSSDEVRAEEQTILIGSFDFECLELVEFFDRKKVEDRLLLCGASAPRDSYDKTNADISETCLVS